MRIVRSFARPSWHPNSYLAAVAGLALAVMAGAASAQTESVLQNIRFGSETILYEAPRLIVRGSRLSQAELTRLLDPSSTEPWSERVMRLDADEIVAPELLATVKTAQIEQRTTYRDVVLKKVGAGKVATLTSSGGTMEGTQTGKKVTGTNGQVVIEDMDVGATFALLNAKAGPSEPLKRLYGRFSMDALRVIDSEGVTTQVGRVGGRDFSAKPTALGWMETVNAMASAEKAQGSPAALRKATDAFADFFDAMSVGDAEATDISVKGRVDGDDLDMTLKKVSYLGAGSGRAGGEVKIEGVEFKAADARFALGTLSFGGLDAKPAMDAMRELALNPDDPSPAVLRRLLPMISSMAIANLEVDMDGPSERAKFGLGRFEIVSDKPINGIPTNLRLAFRNIAVPVPANSKDAGLSTLSELGYEKIDGSFAIDLGWNEPGQEIVIRDVSLDGRDIGTASLRAVIGKVGRDVFDMDTAVASVAALGAAAKSLDLTIDNRGLFERIIAREARRQKRPAEDVRREYGMAASVGIPAILGNGPAAKTLAQAVAKFVAKPGKLTIQVRAKPKDGFGVADYAANPSPAGVLESLDITASAE